jgi:signal transduction histidine kinase
MDRAAGVPAARAAQQGEPLGSKGESKRQGGVALRVIGRVLRIAVAVVLVGVLAFLYERSQTGDLKRQTQISTHLRQLREVDSAWNRHLAATRNEPLGAQTRPESIVLPLQPILNGLTAETAALGNAELDAGVVALRTAFQQKEKLLAQFARDNTKLRGDVGTLVAAVAAARQSVDEALTSSAPGQRARLSALAAQLAALGADLPRVYGQPGANLREAVAAAALQLSAQAQSLAPPLAGTLSALGEPVARLLKDEAALAELAKQVELLPTAPRVQSMNDAFDREFQAIADEKERYRVYLVFYSAALLVFLGYVLMQLGRSYTKLNHVNEALRQANETLEHRVDERTRELSQALKHLKESETLLVQSEKMSSLGQMVAGIAHEINTPLAYVKSSLDTLRERLPVTEGVVLECQRLLAMLERGDVPDDQLSAQFARVATLTAQFQAEEAAAHAKAVAEDALHGIQQISEIILSLKNFSRLDRSKVSRFDLNEGLESTLVIARNLVKHKIVHKKFGEIPLIECAPSQINQVFLNLITNAAQATADDSVGEITLATSVAPGGRVRVDISDNGHGIPENILPKIFDPFFTTKDVGQGTGLGLSIAYKIIQEHGGRIDVKSKVGQGTTFTVVLPIKAAPAQTPAQAQPALA